MPLQRDDMYWHGGAPGLAAGQRIRPAAGLQNLPMEYLLGEQYGSDPTRVYVTTDRTLALMFAGKVSSPAGQTFGGTLYRVDPVGDLQPDPDFPSEAACFTCKAATITEVAQTAIRWDEELEVYGSQFTRWDDGTRVYDDAGFALPSPEMVGAGITAADLRALGKVPRSDHLDEHASRLVVERHGPERLAELMRQKTSPGTAFGLEKG